MGKAWASVGRYDDEYVATLRHRGGAGEGAVPEVTWGGVGGEGGFDTEKMFRSCGKMTSEGDAKASSIAMPEDHEASCDRCAIDVLIDSSIMFIT